ncbi:uncharacterized protein BDZ99DRAFT_468234 [Mytilinidion resinicola]|uniref:Inositol-pentakisphosphate 2-kinase n=1 Tax=Mytilinidion resinicola TaxID=574789 RepID=A0A6A6Y347_9PEZI|nr:uncharacterized protein BDZ99DRAFT_468234 [Mytilinidion resinicola]KAF2803256.1 hypothetical protein BDZ99DRAFT_468234 [Mytilinidion resinicola]
MMVIDYFRTGPGRALLLKLRLWQQELDPAGFESTSHEGIFARDGGRGFAMPIGVARERLKVAMTFRDCSMFVCVHYGAEVPFVEAYLVDLDPKVDEKVGEWLDKEVGLLNQGWYTGKEEGAKREKVCVLAGQMKWDTRGERMWWL